MCAENFSFVQQDKKAFETVILHEKNLSHAKGGYFNDVLQLCVIEFVLIQRRGVTED